LSDLVPVYTESKAGETDPGADDESPPNAQGRSI